MEDLTTMTTRTRPRARPSTARAATLACALVGLVSLSACGDDDEPTADEPTAETTAVAPTTGTTAPSDAAGFSAELQIDYDHPATNTSFGYTIECGQSEAVSGAGAEQSGVDAFGACAALQDPAVAERLIDGEPDDRVCTEQYGGPDVARIVGTLDGSEVDTAADRTNGCAIETWDDLLAPILPPAIGVVDESDG